VTRIASQQKWQCYVQPLWKWHNSHVTRTSGQCCIRKQSDGLVHAHWLVIPITLTYKLYPFFSGTAILMGLHDPEDGGTILLKNISDYLPANTP